jgi:hypothetical protein
MREEYLDIDSMNCPNCGAPLPETARDTWVCLYCQSLVRLEEGEEAPGFVIEKSVTDEEMAEIKQALLNHSRDNALQLYRQLTGSSEEEAQKAIDELGRQLSLKAIIQQQLSPIGWLFVAIWLGLFIGTVVAWATGFVSGLMAVLLAGFAFYNLVSLYPTILISLRYLKAPRAPATTINFAYIGKTLLRREPVHLYKILLDVQPEGAESFRAQALIPVRERNRSRVQVGHVIRIKYLPDQEDSVIFDR